MKNFVFISPHFPNTYYRFAKALRDRGFNVLGVGDSPFHDIKQEVWDSLTEYVCCFDMDNFENEVNALKYLEYKYGPIDYIESNNEYWLNKDAKLRDIFNVNTGVRGEEINNYQHKDKMKKFFQKAGAKVADYIIVDTYENLLAFANKVGYPIFIKPNKGVGAAGDYKIKNIEDLHAFFEKTDKNTEYICEQFVTGNIVSFDGISNSKGDVIFCSSCHFPPSISDVLNEQKDFAYYCVPKVDKDLEVLGRKIVKAFNLKNRCFHIEFFRLTKDIKGLGKIGDLVALEANMRSPGGYTPDLINFANSVDCYQIFGDSFAYDENRQYMGHKKYYATCVARRDCYSYLYSDEEILSRYSNAICAYGRYPDVFSGCMGNRYFMAKFSTKKEMDTFNKIATKRG